MKNKAKSTNRKLEFGRRLTQSMQDEGLKQIDVVDLISVGSGSISSWSNGKNIPRQDSLDKLAELLNVSPDWLLNGDKPKPVLSSDQPEPVDDTGSPADNADSDNVNADTDAVNTDNQPSELLDITPPDYPLDIENADDTDTDVDTGLYDDMDHDINPVHDKADDKDAQQKVYSLIDVRTTQKPPKKKSKKKAKKAKKAKKLKKSKKLKKLKKAEQTVVIVRTKGMTIIKV